MQFTERNRIKHRVQENLVNLSCIKEPINQKIQVDVKFVLYYCIADGKKYCQYTAIDESTRFCYQEMYDEHNIFYNLFRAGCPTA